MRKRYRNGSWRAQWWDYSWKGAYFITICTHNKERILSAIQGPPAAVVLTPIGEIAYAEWIKSFEIRKELICDIAVIMPNHIHAILRIENHPTNYQLKNHGLQYHAVDENLHEILHTESSKKYGIAYRPPRSVSSFVAGFKSSATKKINESLNTPSQPVWHPRFHDHIIRDEFEYRRIYKYIEDNPMKWIKAGKNQ